MMPDEVDTVRGGVIRIWRWNAQSHPTRAIDLTWLDPFGTPGTTTLCYKVSYRRPPVSYLLSRVHLRPTFPASWIRILARRGQSRTRDATIPSCTGISLQPFEGAFPPPVSVECLFFRGSEKMGIHETVLIRPKVDSMPSRTSPPRQPTGPVVN
ncbi:hypothetical protein BV22DRAFT_336145 [Leucogyrophana mollusca]|uniref:Uncharacterized protein n=1 Tax=Leucogyrophana mollusca TaxID=85980 RepID=A0ACB8BLX3_9AGAM|nr:hypothetical protein BV22DRAFT_336145 [Leucogyrophana mollusca]